MRNLRIHRADALRLAAAVAAVAALVPGAAFAYVGPGAGLSLLGALWGLIVAIGLALAFVLAWPLRRMLRGRRKPVRTGQTNERAPAGAGVRSHEA